MKNYFKFLARILAVATLLVVTTSGAAFAQTPEGTVITNTATATFTDANNNTYAAVNASAAVTVGFQAGLDVIAPTGPFNPASPSTGNTLDFFVKNIGNGTDEITMSDVIGTPGVITVDSLLYNGTYYLTVASLNAALASGSDSIVQGDSIAIQVVYSVPTGQGGNNTDYTLRATSNRTPATFDEETVNIAITGAFSVAVTPDGAPVSQLPSVGTGAGNYSQVFAVQNTGNVDDSYTLVATNPPGLVITGITILGPNPLAVTAGNSVNVTVEYRVAQVAAGSTEDLVLTATSVAQPLTSFDSGTMNLTVVRPAITMLKEVFRADSITAIGAGTVVPNEVIWYRITVTNSGTAGADTLQIVDVLPAEVTYLSNVPDVAADWNIVEAAGTVTADFTPGGVPGDPLAVAASRHFWIEVRVN